MDATLGSKDNTDDIQFLATLHKRLDDNGSLEKSLTRAELIEGDARQANSTATRSLEAAVVPALQASGIGLLSTVIAGI